MPLIQRRRKLRSYLGEIALAPFVLLCLGALGGFPIWAGIIVILILTALLSGDSITSLMPGNEWRSGVVPFAVFFIIFVGIAAFICSVVDYFTTSGIEYDFRVDSRSNERVLRFLKMTSNIEGRQEEKNLVHESLKPCLESEDFREKLGFIRNKNIDIHEVELPIGNDLVQEFIDEFDTCVHVQVGDRSQLPYLVFCLDSRRDFLIVDIETYDS